MEEVADTDRRGDAGYHEPPTRSLMIVTCPQNWSGVPSLDTYFDTIGIEAGVLFPFIKL